MEGSLSIMNVLHWSSASATIISTWRLQLVSYLNYNWIRNFKNYSSYKKNSRVDISLNNSHVLTLVGPRVSLLIIGENMVIMVHVSGDDGVV